MEANQKNIEGLKEHMDSLFIFAATISYRANHLLPVIQASKSLIGINLDHPPRILLKWLEQYVKDFIPNFKPPSPSDQHASPDTITYAHLEQLILHKEVSKSNIYLTHLLQVADPRHIAEFLMELGAKQSLGSFLFCWSAFRSIQFLGESNGYPVLYHCLSKLLEMEEGGKKNANLLLKKFELYCHQFQIRETKMIRKNKIIPPLDKMILRIERELSKTSSPAIPIILINMIRKEGEQGIISYLSTIKKDRISSNLILLLDALRSALKFSNNPNDLVLCRIFDNCRKNEYVK